MFKIGIKDETVWGDLFIVIACPVKRNHANGLKHQTLAPNAAIKRKHQTLAPNASSNGGDASRVGENALSIHQIKAHRQH